MSDLGRLPVSRRTLLQTGVWVAPVIASAVAVPSRTTSPPTEPTAVARADEFEGYSALTIESTEAGVPLPAGSYIFTATGGVVPSADVFRVTPDLSGYVAPAENSSADAIVVFPDGHTFTVFTAYILTDLLPAGLDPSATLTVTMPVGGGASIPITVPVGEPEPVAALFGPSGTHWPDRTPRVNDTFDHVVEVDPVWDQVETAIRDAHAAYPNGKIKIAVRPGQFGIGNGAGSTKDGVLHTVGAEGRDWRILVVPRDEWGTVTGSGGIGKTDEGYAFVDIHGVTLVGFDFTGQSTLVRNCTDFALAWSTFGTIGITANHSLDLRNVELVECVLPQSIDTAADRIAVRAADGRVIEDLRLRGCYVAPSYKAAGDTTGHTDSMQIGASNSEGSRVRFVSISDTVMFPSSSQTFQTEYTDNITFSRSAVIAGLRGTGRYPLGPDRHVMRGENALWGGGPNNSDAANGVVVEDSIIMGSVSSYWNFDRVTNTVISKPTSAVPASGSFTVDTTLPAQDTPLDPAWLNQYAPMPDPARLSQIWAELAA